MKTLKISLIAPLTFLLGVLTSIIVMSNQGRSFSMFKKHMLHTLEEPLLIHSNDPEKSYYLLPAGTTLNHHHSMPEGFDTYTIYVNFKGPLPLVEAKKPHFIAPIWVEKIRQEDLQDLLNKYPLSKDDLVRILKARKMTRDDLADIVRNWKD